MKKYTKEIEKKIEKLGMVQAKEKKSFCRLKKEV
jgi:hypothetical protein